MVRFHTRVPQVSPLTLYVSALFPEDMARRKGRKKRTAVISTSAPFTKRSARLQRSFRWRGGTNILTGILIGVLLALLSAAYQYLFGNVSLEYLQPLSRGYEFQIKNDTPSDLVVRSFRLDPLRGQRVVYKSTQAVYAQQNDKGEITLPGGNISYVPVAEFRELDGQKIGANSTLKFRVPPLSSRFWMEPEATIVDINYELEATNSVLSALELALQAVNLRSTKKSIRYLVVNNYWTASQSKGLDEALLVACRDDDSLSKLGACHAKR